MLDDEDFTITRNLSEFLATRQAQDCSALLWIDAICIDQGNTSERNNQVPMMRDIYQAVGWPCAFLDLTSAVSSSNDEFRRLVRLLFGLVLQPQMATWPWTSW